MDKIKKEEYKLALIAYLAAAALLFMTLYFPLAAFAVPIILIYAIVKCGWYLGGTAALLSFITFLLFDFGTACVLAAAFLPVIFAVSFVLREKKRFRDSIMISCASVIAGIAMAVGVLGLITGMSVIDYAVESLGNSLRMFDDVYIKTFYTTMRTADIAMGSITKAAVDATPAAQAIIIIQDMLRQMLNLALVNIIIIYSLITGFLYYIITRAVLKKRKAEVVDIPPFSRWALPGRFWLAYILSYIFAAIGASYAWPSFEILELTIYNVYAFVFIIQGLSLLDYLYKTRKMSTGPRIVLHIAGGLILGGIIVWVGIFENVAGIRKRLEARKAV